MSEPRKPTQLEQENQRRLGVLGVTAEGRNAIAAQYSQMLLEHLVGDGIDQVKARHAQWTSELLDGVETAASRGKLLHGLKVNYPAENGK